MKRFVQTSLGTVAVRVHPGTEDRSTGQGSRPWVFLHGASGSWRTFRELTLNRAIPVEYDCVFLDLPGWGDSPGQVPFTVDQQSTAVVEALTALNYRSWCLFGHSMGAVLALDIAASRPEETHAVVALSPTALTAGAALNRPLRYPAMAPLVGMHTLMFVLRALGRTAPVLLRIAERTRLLRLVLGPFFVRPRMLQRRVFVDLAVDARPASFIAAANALKKYDVGIWQQIAAPTVLARGSRDIFTPAAELHALATLIPTAQSVVLAGTGHFAHVEDPVGTWQTLQTALQSTPGSLHLPD